MAQPLSDFGSELQFSAQFFKISYFGFFFHFFFLAIFGQFLVLKLFSSSIFCHFCLKNLYFSFSPIFAPILALKIYSFSKSLGNSTFFCRKISILSYFSWFFPLVKIYFFGHLFVFLFFCHFRSNFNLKNIIFQQFPRELNLFLAQKIFPWQINSIFLSQKLNLI